MNTETDPGARVARAFERIAAAVELLALCHAENAGEDAVPAGAVFAAARAVDENVSEGTRR